MMSESNLNEMRKHMQELEFLISQDLFINESGAFADVFLSATPFAKKDGTFTNTDRRIQRVRSAHPPQGLARPDWEILCDLATRHEVRLNRSTSFAKWDSESPEEILWEMVSVNKDYACVTYERIDKVGLIYPVPSMDYPGAPTLFKETFPSGRGKFHALDYVPVMEQADDEYPFVLTTGRLFEHWHGWTLTRNSALNEAYPEARVEMHPADAEMHGITNDAFDPQALILEFKACAVQLSPAREDELANPEVEVRRGRY